MLLSSIQCILVAAGKFLLCAIKEFLLFWYPLIICIVELSGQGELSYDVHGVQYWETIVRIGLACDCKFTGNCDHRSLTKFETKFTA